MCQEDIRSPCPVCAAPGLCRTIFEEEIFNCAHVIAGASKVESGPALGVLGEGVGVLSQKNLNNKLRLRLCSLRWGWGRADVMKTWKGKKRKKRGVVRSAQKSGASGIVSTGLQERFAPKKKRKKKESTVAKPTLCRGVWPLASAASTLAPLLIRS